MLALPLFGQMKPKHVPNQNSTSLTPEMLSPVQPLLPSVPLATPPLEKERNFNSIPTLPKPVAGQQTLQAHISPETGTPYLISGNFKTGQQRSIDQQAGDYFEAVQHLLKLDNPNDEFEVTRVNVEDDFTHLHYRQQWQGVPVYGAEVILHKKNNQFYMLNGRFFPTPKLTDVTPQITEAEAEEMALGHVSAFTTVKNLNAMEKQLVANEQAKAQLVIFHPAGNSEAEVLAYHVEVVPNITHRYSCFIDAKTGEVIEHRSQLCQLTGHLNNHEGHSCSSHANSKFKTQNSELESPPPPGPETANATDLFGITRTIDVYETGGTFFLIDASRSMFNAAQSDIPNDPAGVIWTIDGQNNSPENSNFQAAHVTSSNNSWNNPIAVSAHYNGGLAYEYFKNTFGRESINGIGGNIVSLINIIESDGADMDNAFWNGQAMFYGNGDVAFDSPLAKSPDVAGHEMAHGVVQATANLEYYGESGALNESFADVFGAMIDRDDWKIGEDIVNTSIFPTGALRDMADPNNGGNSLNDNGWQPAHYSERYTGSQDNAGVHINSGIPNKAFHLFATDVGKAKAEQVYYRALNEYLVKSSQFIDCRIAVVQAATDLHGAGSSEVAAAESAFTSVGIGSGSGTNTQTDVGSNPGDDFVLFADDNFSALYIFTPDGTAIANPLSNSNPISRPSVTDDGSAIVFVDDDNTLQAVVIDWGASSVEQFAVQSDPIWRQVAIAKDGSRFAALTTDYDNLLYVYDYGLAEWETFTLFNPTTGTGGPTTGDVLYADVLEWDFTGQWVMYDALNAIGTTSGTDIEYWDISFANVWDEDAGNFGDGFTSKLFSQLPEDVGVGNPTFSKNSDYIIAFDYIDNFNNEYYLLGTNIETGDVGTIFQNNELSWPSYSPDDSEVLFDAEDTFGNPVLGRIDIANDKISSVGDGVILFDQSRWGVWFANGDRVLTGTEDATEQFDLRAYPNPVDDQLTLEFSSNEFGGARIQLHDLMGRLMLSQNFQAVQGQNRFDLSLGHLPSGQYFLKMNLPQGNLTMKVLK